MTMKLVTDTPLPLEEKRRLLIEALWAHGYRPKGCLERLIREAAFEDEQLYASATPEGNAMLLDMIRYEFRKVEKSKLAERYAQIDRMLTAGFSEREIAKSLKEANLLPSQSWEAAYALTRKDCARVIRSMRAVEAAKKAGAKNLFLRRMERIFNRALMGAEMALSSEDKKGAAALIAQARAAAENAAIVNGVDINGKDRELNRGFDAASELARGVIDSVKARRAAEPEPVAEDDEQQTPEEESGDDAKTA
jgi:hypothetical protein